MPTWSVECAGACSVTGKPESNICTYGADRFLDISHMRMSLRVERIDCTDSVERLLVVYVSVGAICLSNFHGTHNGRNIRE